ncbi:MAG: asparagine synthase-related protein [Rubrivivax sp.]|nr:asparagine synthase-related protein [Rubrivivax sp.]
MPTLLLMLAACVTQGAAYVSLQAPVTGAAFLLVGLLPLAAIWPRDRADELFCGYSRYLRSTKQWRRIRRLPPGVRRSIADLVRAWPGHSRRRQTVCVTFESRDNARFYRAATSQWPYASEAVVGDMEHTDDMSAPAVADTMFNRMMCTDSHAYLPDDVLTDVDRAAMAVGLETRAPLLDHRVVELAWSRPARVKLRDSQTKWTLRSVLERYVP